MVLSVASNIALLAVGIAFGIWFLRSSHEERRKTSEKMFADRYGTCVFCGSQPLGHPSWMVSMAIVSRVPNRVSELEQLVAQRDWERASMNQEFEGTEDEVEYRLVKCPASNQISLKKILSTFELWSNDQLLEDILLAEDDQDRLNTLAGSEWSVLGTAEVSSG